MSRLNFRRLMFGVVCIFTIRTEKIRIRVTVKKVELKQTVIENKTKTEHKRHHKGSAQKTSEEIVTKETNVAAVNFITGY